MKLNDNTISKYLYIQICNISWIWFNRRRPFSSKLNVHIQQIRFMTWYDGGSTSCNCKYDQRTTVRHFVESQIWWCELGKYVFVTGTVAGQMFVELQTYGVRPVLVKGKQYVRINASTNYCYFKCNKYTLYSLCILYGGMLLFAFDARLYDTLSFLVLLFFLPFK